MTDSGTRLAIQTALETRLTFIERKGRDFNYECPFCAKRGQRHTLHVRYETRKSATGVAICHSCEYKTRDLLWLIRDLFGAVPRRFDVLIRAATFAQDVEDILRSADEEQDKPVPLPESFRRIPYKGTGVPFLLRRYLEKRGFTYDDIDQFGIGYLEDEDHPAYGYVIFPFYMRGECVYWQGRRVLGHGPKSYNPENTGKKCFLYGYDQAESRGTLFVAEGPLDAIAWGRGGLGLTGKVIQPQQVRAIALMRPKRVIVCLDGPKADGSEDAYAETKKIAWTLRRALPCRVGYLLLEEGDPADNRGLLRRFASRMTVWLKGGDSDIADRVRGLLE